MWWRRKARGFEVLGQRFELPTLRLAARLERAARLRKRLGATWFEALVDPLLTPFRKAPARVVIGFGRAHRVLSAHEQIVLAALDHVAVYDDALGRATRHVTERAHKKLAQLLERAAERQRVAERAVHLAERVRPQLEHDLGLFAERIKAVARAAHLMLVRLRRYRSFVRQTLAALVKREAELAAQRELLVHDEHAWHIDRELQSDSELARWIAEPDRLCAGIESSLRQLVGDLDGLESGLAAVPAQVERLLAQAEAVELGVDGDPLGGLAVLDAGLPGLADVPVRLDDGDWDSVEQHEHEGELVFGARSVEALGVEVEQWLASVSGTGPNAARRCATCPEPIVSGAMLGRAHVLCASCRDQALAGGHEWLRRIGFEPTRRGSTYETGPITRVVFESVMGWVPSAGPAHEPVTDVSWHEAIAFCNALSSREGREPAYHAGHLGSSGTIRLRAATTGWRLPESAGEARGLREWLWAGTRDGEAGQATPRKLGPGLRLIGVAGGGATERRVPEARDPDLGFRAVAPWHEPAAVRATPPHARSRPERAPRPQAAPVARRAPSPDAKRRVGQAVGLLTLVSAAGLLVMNEVSPAGAPALPGSDSRTEGVLAEPPSTGAPAPPVDPAGPGEPGEPESPTAPVAAPGPPSPAEPELERGYTARAKKDRKGARARFEKAIAVDPSHLPARYEAAREAAYARDVTAAFAHLDALVARADQEPRAQQLLADALVEPDFAKLARDPRWKRLQREAAPP